MIRRRARGTETAAPAEGEAPSIDARELSGVFDPPGWLRDAGFASWLLVGIALLAAALIAVLSLTAVIVMPVITAAIVASVGSLLVAWLQAHRVPRAAGAISVLLLVVAVGVGLFLAIVGGITAEASEISGHLDGAKNEVGDWLRSIGVDASTVDAAKKNASSALSGSFSGIMDGVLSFTTKLSSLVFFLALTTLSLFFLLKDGPTIRSWTESHLGVPEPVARTITGRVLGSLRGYFLGVTLVAAFNAVVVTIGALILGVPMVATIAVVTFVGAYIPYLGAWSAAGFSVLIALGGAGPEAAGGMVIVQLLANGVLQQLVQPFAMGAALGIHPLAVLIVTIAGGALFGAIGLILAAPITSAITRITTDLAAARRETAEAAEAAEAADAPAAASPAPT